jgi:conjugal transfer pilus assembly protein TraF
MRCFAPASSALVFVGSVWLSATLAAASDFYERDGEGWFWYDDPVSVEPQPEPPSPKAAEPQTAAAPTPVPQLPPTPAVQEEAPRSPPLSAAWFRQHLETYRDLAMDHPTPENVELFMLLQKAMMDKAEAFSAVSERVVVGHAALDEVARRPITNLGANIANRAAGERRDAVLAEIARSVAIWFFYRSDCPHCEAQAPLLQLLEQHYGFTVLAISIDGLPMPGGFYPRYIRDAGQAAYLGVTTTPSMFLVHPASGDVSGLGRGMLSLAELRERIVISAVRAQWIDEATASSTRAVAGAPTLGPVSPAAPEDPMALLDYLKARERNAESPLSP